MSTERFEILDGFIVRPGRLRRATNRERPAATHLIAKFPFGESNDGHATGTVVWFQGNTRGVKVASGFEIRPEDFGTAPRGFWTRLEDDLVQSARIDRQKYSNDGPRRFCIYALQIGEATVASVLVRVNTNVGVGVMRRAFTLSLDNVMHVAIDPTDIRKGYAHVR